MSDETTTELTEETQNEGVALVLEDGDLPFAELMSENFLRYAVSTLTDRALPDIRDGLLPVHRRILLAMWTELRLRHNSRYVKSARVVGETMGKFHPHGDASIYGAMVRMAQDFSMRVPLVDGHGGFGSIDDDPPAAARYTEARITRTAERLLEDLDKEILPDDFGRNYDGSRDEAHVLPAAFPNLLVNGAIGIAVGMTAEFLPHNPVEVLDLCLWRLAHPEASLAQMVKRIPGPDFPTGATVLANEGLRQAYMTGDGKVTALGEAHIEPMPGGREKIIITSLPWGVMKGSQGGTGLLQVISKQHSAGRYDEMAEMQDYSNEDGMRVEIELKRGANARAVLQRLYKHTRLRETYGVKMNCLVGGRPVQVNLGDIVDQFLEFRRGVLIKRAEKRIREIEVRLHKLDAFLKALGAIDAVVKLLKSSKNRAEAKPKLQKLLKIDEQQAQWIIEMPLGSLTALDRFEIEEEAKKLREELAHWKKFIKTPALVTEALGEELKEVKKLMPGERLTKIVSADDSESGDDGGSTLDFSVPAEDCVLLISQSGRGLCGQGTLRRGASLQLDKDDRLAVVELARTDQEWVVFTDNGQAYRLRLAELPLEGRKVRGEDLRKIIGLAGNEKIVAAHRFIKDRAGSALFVYDSGNVKRTAWKEFASVHSSGIAAAKPADGEHVIAVHDCPDDADILLVGSHGKANRFTAASCRNMGRVAGGVRGIGLPADARVVGSAVVRDPTEQVLLVTSTRFAKRVPFADIPVKGRGVGGVVMMKVGGKYGAPAFALGVPEKADIYIQVADGRTKIVEASSIPRVGRAIVPKPFDQGKNAASVFAIVG